MIKLNKIKIINFQKTVSMEQEFVKDINVITGLTDTGKTCIFNAMMWLFGFLTIKELDYRKEGTNQTSVEGWFDDGIQVERIRSNTINRYILKKGGHEDKVFDSFGKNLPEEVQLVLGMSEIEIDDIRLNLNFASQDNLNFVLDKRVYPASFSAKLFNKLTGNELLDKLFKVCNKESLSINKNLKITESNIEEKKKNIIDSEDKFKEMSDKLSKIKKIYEKVSKLVERYQVIEKLQSEIKENKEQLEFVRYKIDKIKVIDEKSLEELKRKIDKFEEIDNLLSELRLLNHNLKQTNKKINGVVILEINFEKLKKMDEKLRNIKEIQKEFVNIDKQKVMIREKIVQVADDLRVGEIELKEIWNKCEVCPLCKNKINNI